MSKVIYIEICMGSSCFVRGNKGLADSLRKYLTRHHLEDRVILKGSLCQNDCGLGPWSAVGDVKLSGEYCTIENIIKELEKLLNSGE